MRLKHIKGSEEVMLTSPHITQEPQTLRGAWKRPGEKLFLEIGMGKGQFITQKASADPDNIYIGIEKYSSVMLRAVEKEEQLMLPNLRLIRVDAEQMGEIFAPGEVDAVFLNFSDPWPKDRHAKRRLTSPQFSLPAAALNSKPIIWLCLITPSNHSGRADGKSPL